MDKTLSTRENYSNKEEKYKDNGTNICYYLLPNMSAFALHTFFICFKLFLKQLGVRVEFFNTGNLHKDLSNRILK